MFIVVEGLDGAGKSTQVKRLRKFLEQTQGGVDYIHFPRYDAPVYGELITRFLKGEFGSNESVHPQLVALLFAEDRHGAAEELKNTIAQGRNLLLDRYVYSNIAYQCAKLRTETDKERLRQWIFDTEYKEFGLPVPDLNVFLDVPVDFVQQRLTAQRQGDDRAYLDGGQDIHEADIEFQKAVRAMYLRQCELDPNFIRIDCSGPQGEMLAPDDVFRKLMNEVSFLINK